MTNWIQATELENIPILGSRVFRSGEQEIAIFRTREDRVFALHNACPHQQGVLSEGIVHGHQVTCPLHNWVISLEDGEAQGADEGQTACFEVQVRQGIVYINL
ncbi:MAG: nitrite reductase small subunit NirD [Gammaproteobacteria bacterium]|nr:nitrite reductase small subunit NirD [Gammaproteobacteria bacterium]